MDIKQEAVQTRTRRSYRREKTNMGKRVEKKELREGLKRLKTYADRQGCDTDFLEEGPQLGLDCLIFHLGEEEGQYLDVSCNFIYAEDIGTMLQFYGQISLDGLTGEEELFTEQSVLKMVNRLNLQIPLGQLLYIQGEGGDAVGIRYTMLTALDSEAEFDRCLGVISVMTGIYDLLGGELLTMAGGELIDSALDAMKELVEEL